jgi:hypothetical protein
LSIIYFLIYSGLISYDLTEVFIVLDDEFFDGVISSSSSSFFDGGDEGFESGVSSSNSSVLLSVSCIY